MNFVYYSKWVDNRRRRQPHNDGKYRLKVNHFGMNKSNDTDDMQRDLNTQMSHGNVVFAKYLSDELRIVGFVKPNYFRIAKRKCVIFGDAKSITAQVVALSCRRWTLRYGKCLKLMFPLRCTAQSHPGPVLFVRWTTKLLRFVRRQESHSRSNETNVGGGTVSSWCLQRIWCSVGVHSLFTK